MNEIKQKASARNSLEMLARFFLCIIFPALAIFDKGCFPVILVYCLTVIGFVTSFLLSFASWGLAFLFGWLPAALVAMIFCFKKESVNAEEEDTEIQINTSDIFELLFRYVLCILFPPLGVIGLGCGSMIAVFFFTLCGWLPGVILAILICLKSRNYYRIRKKQ